MIMIMTKMPSCYDENAKVIHPANNASAHKEIDFHISRTVDTGNMEIKEIYNILLISNFLGNLLLLLKK